MKKVSVFLMTLMLTIAAMGQTLNVKVGSVTYQFPASQTGEMTYEDGETLTIMGKTFVLADIDAMTVDETEVTDNQVAVVYDGKQASVTVAGNVAQYVTPTISGAHVSIAQTNTDAVDDDEITYVLSGTTTDGEFALDGSYKCTVSLASVTMTNPTGAAININNKKRIQISAKNGTVNTLTDGADANESWKACLYSKGQMQLQGKGSLTVNGNTKHAIKSGDYISVKNLTLNVKTTAGDGISCNKYFVMESGTVTITSTGDEGIQCDLEEDDDTTGETNDHEDENSGNIYIEGGTLTVSTSATGSKGVNAEGSLYIREGNVTTNLTVTNSGAVDASDSSDLVGSACLKAEKAIDISGGTLKLTNTGQGGRAINSDGTLTISGGTIDAQAQGTNYGSSNNQGGGGRPGGWGGWGGNTTTSSHKYAKGVKADGDITITGGTTNVYSKSHEGLESKGNITISGGQLYVQASDDAINAAGDLTVSGGQVCGYSTGNDGLDSNGNMYIKGGLVYAICSGTPEVALDANTEGGKKLYVQGGTIIAIGGIEGGSSLTQSCYSASSWSKSTWYAITVGNDTFAFKTPSSGGSGIVLSGSSKPTLKSGVSVSGGTSIFNGMGNVSPTISGGTTVTLSDYTSSSRR
ncbi:MAG: carbohydrate-binding domain-containing protein [Bacteroidaceae bacterium]|nr:carbohydrate-binding domain-containing protein [Bacteroidaceae bacterium]